MLEVRHVHVTGPSAIPCFQLHGGSVSQPNIENRIHIISTTSHSNRIPLSTLCRSFEVASGLQDNAVSLPLNNIGLSLAFGPIDNWKALSFAGTHIAMMDTENGTFAFIQNYPGAQAKRLQVPTVLKVPLKMGHRVTLCCSSRSKDRMVFLTASNSVIGQPSSIDNTFLHALLLADNSATDAASTNNTNSRNGVVSAPLSLDLNTLLLAITPHSHQNQYQPQAVQASQVSITSLTCHPTKPLLLIGLYMPSSAGNTSNVGNPNGCVAVWSYAALRRRLVEKLSGRKKAQSSVNTSINDDDDDSQQIDDDNDGAGGNDDAASDSGSVASRNSSVTSSAVGGMRGFFNRIGRSSAKSSYVLPLRGLLLPPKVAHIMPVSSVAISRLGDLVGLVWGGQIVAVYDSRFRGATAESSRRPSFLMRSDKSDGSLATISTARSAGSGSGAPIASNRHSLTAANVGQVADVGASLVQQISPIASTIVNGTCQSIDFHPMEPILIMAGSTSAGQQKIVFLSLLDSQLPFIGKVDVGAMLDLNLGHGLHRQEAIVQSVSCSELTGRIILHITTAPSSSGRAVMNAHPNDSMPTSSARSALLAAASSSTPPSNRPVSLLVAVCALGPSYRSLRGAALAPVISTVSVPTQAYLEGADHAMRRFKPCCEPTLDTSSDQHSNKSPVYPMILAIKPSIDVSTSSKPLRIIHHLFQVSMRVGTSLTAESAKVAGTPECLFGYLGTIPSVAEGPPAAKQPQQTQTVAPTKPLSVDDLLDFSVATPMSEQPPDNNAAPWISLPSEDRLPAGFKGTFVPRHIKPNEQQLLLQQPSIPTETSLDANHKSVDCWTVLVKGYVIVAESAPQANKKPSESLVDVVCLTLYTQPVRPSTSATPGAPVSATPSTAPLQHVFATYRDADFWTGASANVRPVTADYPPALLALDSSGTRIKWLKLQPTTTDFNPTSTISTQLGSWPMPHGLIGHKLWTAPLGAPNFVLYLCEDISAPDQSPRWRILASTRGSPTITSTSTSSSGLILEPHESVIEVQWQSAVSNNGNDLRLLWLPSSACALVGVLTNRRALILQVSQDGTLSTANSSNFSKARHGAMTSEQPCSITWAGATLLISSESGAVDYLLPGQVLHPKANVNVLESKIVQQLCGRSNSSAGFGRLASLARSIAQTGAFRLVSCLPDRLLFASFTLNPSGGIEPYLQLHCRPCQLAEPVLLGSIACINSSEATTTIDSASSSLSLLQIAPTTNSGPPANDTLCLLAARFVHANQRLSGAAADQHATEAGAAPSGQISADLLLALMESSATNGKHLAAAISGFALDGSSAATASQQGGSGSSSGSSSFPACRWLPSELKFLVAMQSGLPEAAGIALLAAQPQLQERLADPDFFGPGLLPNRRSVLARQCAAAARLMLKLGKADHSKRLADLAGDDAMVASLIARLTDGDADRKAFAETLSGRDPKLQQAVLSGKYSAEELMNFGDPNCETSMSILREGPENKLVMRQAFESSRRNAMFTLKGNVRLKDIPPTFQRDDSITNTSKPSSLVVASDVSNSGSSNKNSQSAQVVESRFRATQWPLHVVDSPSLGAMAMDRIEDWLGLRLKPEGIAISNVDVDAQKSLGLDGATAGSDPSRSAFNTASRLTRRDGPSGGPGGVGALPPGITTKPDTWCEEAGIMRGAKEHDKVAGYWRFSDLLLSPTAGSATFKYINSGRPSTKAVALDLSKHLIAGQGFNCLEVFYCVGVEMAIEPTTSNVDPGEDHEKVKSLNDLVVVQRPAIPPAGRGANDGPHADMFSGLRVLVGRGGPLDIGPVHADPDRSKLTIELMVKVNAATIAHCGNGSGNCSYLFRRITGSSDCTNPEAQVVLYSLAVDSKGTLILSGADNQDSSLTLKSPEGILVNPQAAALLAGGDEDDGDGDNDASSSYGASGANASVGPIATGGGEWVHVAVVLDFSKSPQTNSTQQQASAQIVINGQRVARGSLTLTLPAPFHTSPSALEPLLATSTLYLAANLPAGFRVTEVRCWADIRTTAELEEQRDNYLPLASKRKRQQLRVKGTKEIFAASSSSVLTYTALPKATASDDQDSQLVLPDLAATSKNEENTVQQSSAAGKGAPIRPAFLGPAGGSSSNTIRPLGLAPPSNLRLPTVSAEASVDAIPTTQSQQQTLASNEADTAAGRLPSPAPLLGNPGLLAAPTTSTTSAAGTSAAGTSQLSAAARRKLAAANAAAANVTDKSSADGSNHD